MSKRLVISSLWAMLALGSAVFAMQQKQPSMHGRIVDASNKPISGFKLIAHRAGTAEEFMTVTNENGEFNFAELPAGTYFLQNPAAPAGNPSSPTVTVDPSTSRDVNLQTDPSGKIEYPAQTHIPSTASAERSFCASSALTAFAKISLRSISIFICGSADDLVFGPLPVLQFRRGHLHRIMYIKNRSFV